MIIIDGISLIFPPCGIKTFASSLLLALNQYYSAHPTDLKYSVVFPQFNPNQYFDYQAIAEFKKQFNSKNIFFKPLQTSRLHYSFLKLIHQYSLRNLTFIWSFIIFPSFIKKSQKKLSIKAIIHPYQILSNYKSVGKKIVIVHDVYHWIDQQRYSFIPRLFYNLAAQACRHCNKIITISNYSKNQISRVLKIEPKKIAVCYESINPAFLIKNSSLLSKNQLGILPDDYCLIIMSISSRNKYKNLLANIKLFHRLIQLKQYNNSHIVFVGGNLDTNQLLKKYLFKHQLLTRAHFFQFVSDQELQYLYQNAQYLFFLSQEEGFGLPPLEALANHTFPIIADTGAIQEIYSPYLPTFNPTKLESIVQYLHALDNKRKKQIIKFARTKLLKRYSWEKIIENYLAEFKK